MKYSLCILWMLLMFYAPLEQVNAQEVQPPSWSVGDWWIVKSQRYDLGEIVDEERQPRWLPLQTWRFEVENQETIADQAYFVVDIRPVEDNPCPYRFRYWFRRSDRYVGRYDMLPLKSASITRTQKSDSSVVRKRFDPNRTTPFLTTKFPLLPLTMPVFNTSGQTRSTFAEDMTIRSQTSASYTGPEFDIIQEIRDVEAQSLTEKAHPAFVGFIGNLPQNGNVYITLQASSSIQETQHWNSRFPWCMYGERIEHGTLIQRYWLITYGHKG